ncbi:hypothetical protein C8F01DRAFT_1137807 [Mycena amicta]|nr:hypothetical protein C8F01DRAFT_1137807 [Mycena amicta]
MDIRHPLLIPELIDLLLWNLHTSRQDLVRCALVARAWTYPSQAHLFRLIRFHDEPSTWSPLIQTLASCPHLIQHVRRLQIIVGDTPMDTSFEDALEQIGDTVQSANALLEAVTFAYLKSILTNRCLRVLRGLLRIPTLRAVALQCMFPSIGKFARLWTGCSPGIRHLKLIYSVTVKSHGQSEEEEDTPKPRRPSIQLDSLFTMYSTEDPAMKLLPFHIFKLENLSVLHLRQSQTRQLYASNYASLRELHLGIPDPDPFPRFTAPPAPLPIIQHSPVDLSAIPHLTFLGLSFPTIPKTIQTAIVILSTLTPTANPALRTIQLTPMRHVYNFMPSPVGMPEARALDQRLASLGLSEEVEVWLNAGVEEVWDTWRSELLRVDERNMLRRAERECDCCRPLSGRP